MRRILTILLLIFSVCELQAQVMGRHNVDSFPKAPGQQTYGLTWLPQGYNYTGFKRYPLIVFLHGAGETGTTIANLSKLYSVTLSPPGQIAAGWNATAVNPLTGVADSFIVISPQANSWSYSYTELKYILPNIISRYRIDTSRIYLTGLSAGGGGVISTFGSRDSAFINKFAAMATASSAGTNASNGYTAVQVEAGIRYGSGYGSHFWTVAGEADYLLNTDVKYHDSTNKLNPSPANKLTVVATIGHAAWTKLYDTLFRPVVNYYGSTGNCQNGCNNGGITVAPNTNGSSVRGSGITQDSLNVYEWFLTKTRNIPNTPVPTAVAGADQAITLPTNSVTVDGNGSSAGSGATFTSIVWSRLIGPVDYTITSPNTLSTTITGLASGHYVFRLTVINSVGISSTDDLVVDVTGNVTYGHPTVTLTSTTTQNITTSSTTISASYTVGGSTIKSIKWTKLKTPGQATKKIVWIGSSTIVGNGASVFDSAVHNRTVAFANAHSLLSTDVNLAVGGTSVYQAMPTGYANTGLQDAPDTSMNITKALSLNPDIIIVGFPSNDYDILTIGEIMAAYRTIHAAAVSAGKICYLMTAQPRTAFGPAGERMLRDITDSLRASELSQWVIDTHTPVTDYDGVTELYGAGDGVHQNNEGHRMLFNNTVSRNLWTTWATSASVITQPDSLSTTVTGLVDGEHKFLVAITDAHEQTAYAVTTINVTTLGNQSPTANAGGDQSITLPVSSVSLTGSGTDPDGTITTYAWTKISGTGGTITTPSAANTTFTGLSAGNYSLKLVVTDNNGATDADTVNVTVSAAPTTCSGISYVAAASPDGSTGYFNTHNLQPGDTLILDGTYTYVYVANRNGTASCPIVITNRNGQAKLRTDEMKIENCSYVKVEGNGSADLYGISIMYKQADTIPIQGKFGISITGRSRKIDVKRVSIRRVNIGVEIKQDPTCDTLTWYGNWIMDSVTVDSCEIVGTGNQGLYIGNTSPDNPLYSPRPITCNSVVIYPQPFRLGSITVKNCYIDSTGRSGVQISTSSEGMNYVTNNIIKHNGLNGDEAQPNAVLIGSYTSAEISYNTISNTLTYGIGSIGGSNTDSALWIHHNTIDSSGYLRFFDNSVSAAQYYKQNSATTFTDTFNYARNIHLQTVQQSFSDSAGFRIQYNSFGIKKSANNINLFDAYNKMHKAVGKNCISNNVVLAGGSVAISVEGANPVYYSDCLVNVRYRIRFKLKRN